jgi:hypothetical protein
MASIKSIYENSNFYKEARIVNFLAHMYEHILTKMRKEFTIMRIMNWANEIQSITEILDYWKITNSKFDEGFFLRDLMQAHKFDKRQFVQTMNHFKKESSSIGVSMHSTQTTFSHNKLKVKSEKAKYKSHIEEWSKYSDNIKNDISKIIRPSTAYGTHGAHDMSGSTGSALFSDDMTRPNSSWKRARVIKPSQLLQKEPSKKTNTFWFEIAEDIIQGISTTTQVLENIDYIWNMIFKLQKEYIPQIKKMHTIEGRNLIKQIEGLVSIYQLTPVDFDMFHHKSFSVFEWYVEGFETKVKNIESKFNQLEDEKSGGINYINQEETKQVLEEDEEDNEEDHLNNSSNDMVKMSWNVS